MLMYQTDFYFTGSKRDLYGGPGVPDDAIVLIWIGDFTPESGPAPDVTLQITDVLGIPQGWGAGIGQAKGKGNGHGVYLVARYGTIDSFKVSVIIDEIAPDPSKPSQKLKTTITMAAEFSMIVDDFSNLYGAGGVFVGGPRMVYSVPGLPFAVQHVARGYPPLLGQKGWDVQYGFLNQSLNDNPYFQMDGNGYGVGAFSTQEIATYGPVVGGVGKQTDLPDEGTFSYTITWAGYRYDAPLYTDPQTGAQNVRIFISEPIQLPLGPGLPVIPPGGGGIPKDDDPIPLIHIPQYAIDTNCIDPCQPIGLPHLLPLTEVQE